MPHLKTLVERHENDPFALIGINTGDSPDAFQKGVKDLAGCSFFSCRASVDSDYFHKCLLVKLV